MNPLKETRLHTGLTQKNLATNLGMTPHAILRYEQGLYEDLSPTLADYTAQVLELTPEATAQAYHDFQMARRQESAQYFEPWPRLVMDPRVHPFVLFRNDITMRAVGKKTRVGFCILLAMNPAVLIQYENGVKRNLTPVMGRALKQAFVSAQHLEDLDSYGEIWCDRHGC